MSTSAYRLLGVLTVAFWGMAAMVVLAWFELSVLSPPSSKEPAHPQKPGLSSVAEAAVRGATQVSDKVEPSMRDQTARMAASRPADDLRPRVVIPDPASDATEQDRAKNALLRQLAQATDIDVGIDNPAQSSLSSQLHEEASLHQWGANELPSLLIKRADLHGLLWAMGKECQMEEERARYWQTAVDQIRGSSVDGSQPPATLLNRWTGRTYSHLNPEPPVRLVPVLLQMFQAEPFPIRLFLIDLLANIKGPEAGAALAHRAVFDPEPDLRLAALAILLERPNQEGHKTLVATLRHHWTPAAEHAADALLVLNAKETISDLIQLLDEPNPSAPTASASPGCGLVVRELVRVNHLRNCLLCHTPTRDVRNNFVGRVPSPDQSLPPSLDRRYYSNRQPGSVFVRADVTYLRQEFSVALPVVNPGKWPKEQRYDFLIRTRPATATEVVRAQMNPTAYPQREAVLRALRGLTGKDFGKSSKPWKEFLGESRRLAARY